MGNQAETLTESFIKMTKGKQNDWTQKHQNFIAEDNGSLDLTYFRKQNVWHGFICRKTDEKYKSWRQTENARAQIGIFIFKCLFFYERERELTSQWGRGIERGTEDVPDSREPDVVLEPMNCDAVTWAEVRCPHRILILWATADYQGTQQIFLSRHGLAKSDNWLSGGKSANLQYLLIFVV